MPAEEFFTPPEPVALQDLAGRFGLEPGPGFVPSRTVTGLASLASAGPGDLAFFNKKAPDAAFSACRAGACLVLPELAEPRHAGALPEGAALLLSPDPRAAFAVLQGGSLSSALRAGRPRPRERRARPRERQGGGQWAGGGRSRGERGRERRLARRLGGSFRFARCRCAGRAGGRRRAGGRARGGGSLSAPGPSSGRGCASGLGARWARTPA